MKLISIITPLLALVLFVSGCQEFAPEESFYKFRPPAEKTGTIDTLKLTPQTPEDENKSPVQKPSPEVNEMKLSLEQCRAFTLQNNLDLKIQLIEPAKAGETVSEEEAKFEAAFFANGAYSKINRPLSTTLEGSNVDTTAVDTGVQVPLKSGGTATVNLIDSKTKTNNPYATLDPQYDADMMFSITQPLLRNAGKKVNTYSIRIAGYELDFSRAQTKLEMIRVLSAAERAYWRLYAAQRVLDVRQQEYELANAQLKQTKRFVEIGETAASEIVRAEAGVASTVEAIIIAGNDLRDRQREIKQILNIAGMPPKSKTILIPATQPDPVHYALDKQQLVTQAIDNRMEMLEVELELAIAAENIDFLKNQALPLVTFNYSYRLNGLGATRSDAYDMLFDSDFTDHAAELRLLVPLGNQQAESRVRRAIYEKKQKLATKERRELTIQNEVLIAADNLESNWQKIIAARQNAIMAGRLYEVEKHQFEVGLRTATDVLNAQTDFANAQLSEIAALTDYEIGRVDLAYATGTLLGKTKIHWSPASDLNNN